MEFLSPGKVLLHNTGDAFRMERGMTKPMEPAPKFIQMKGESDEMFLRRVNKKTSQVLLKSQIEDKYGVW